MDVKGDKVEQWKLTPEQAAWAKKYKKLKQIEGIIKNQTMVEQGKFQTLQEMYGKLTQEFEGLRQQAPAESVHEMSDMNFKEE